jgi:hypothetical protein
VNNKQQHKEMDERTLHQAKSIIKNEMKKTTQEMKINIKTFIVSTCIIMITLVFSFMVAFAEDDGNIDKNSNLIIFVELFNIFKFPIHILFAFFSKNLFLTLLGFFFNCCFYGFLVERVFAYFKKKG